MKEVITPDLFSEFEEDNRKFFKLLDPLQWDLLMDKYADPDNKKEMRELLTELLEG